MVTYKNIEEIPTELKNRKTRHAPGGTRVSGVYYNRTRDEYGVLQWKGPHQPLIMRIDPDSPQGVPLTEWAEELVAPDQLGGGSVKHVKKKQPWKKVLYLTLKLKADKINRIVAQARADGKTRGCDHHKLDGPMPIRTAVEAQDRKLKQMGIEWHQRHTKGLHVHKEKQYDKQMNVLRCQFCTKQYNYQKRVQMHELVCHHNPLNRNRPRVYRKRRLSAAKLPVAKRQHMTHDDHCKQEFAQQMVAFSGFAHFSPARQSKIQQFADFLFTPISQVAGALTYSPTLCPMRPVPSVLAGPWAPQALRPGEMDDIARLTSLSPPPDMVASRSNSRSPSLTPPAMVPDHGGFQSRSGSPLPLELPPAVMGNFSSAPPMGMPLPPAINTFKNTPGFAPIAAVQLPRLPKSPFPTSANDRPAASMVHGSCRTNPPLNLQIDLKPPHDIFEIEPLPVPPQSVYRPLPVLPHTLPDMSANWGANLITVNNIPLQRPF